eukprot:CAMPEP_0196572254 /NCGR_PEP_ID=MMETSP1081-20130531/2340_1 /TAXON_ID=36882 /ORGANISM="Pyramimonas amylifera, Strain CCMP720" /LENGTH=654 /DNA_ID=CAMNT_0041889513 /DNA_START=76 /DNA_END=2040 /DNA_ORIENTATION=+
MSSSSSSYGLWWKGISYRIHSKGKDKWILCGLSGSASAGDFLAVLGPSGSGKTTLLKILSQRLERVKGAHLGGEVKSVLSGGGSVAYVAQDSGFFSCLTVKETLKFHVGLQGSQHGGPSEEEVVTKVVQRLGLSECVDTLVGGDSGGTNIVGISGGERRRLAIGTQIVGTDIGCIIADEPTTGLDTFQAEKVVETLGTLAKDQMAAVLCSLHAPRSSIFYQVQHVLVLSLGGRAVYMGPTSSVLDYFSSVGHSCPGHFNPAEFLVDMVSVDSSSPLEQASGERRVKHLQAQWEINQPTIKMPEEKEKDYTSETAEQSITQRRRGLGGLRQFLVLSRRALRQQVRDKTLNVSRAVASALLGLALGTINYKLGNNQASIRSRASLLMQEIANGKRSQRSGGCSASGRAGGYSVGAYLLAKLAIETPLDAVYAMLFAAIAGQMAHLNPRTRKSLLMSAGLQATAASSVGLGVSALTPSIESAQALGPVVMVLSLMLGDTGGMFAPIPEFIKPLARMSCIKWGFQGCMVAEFEGLTFEKDVDGVVPSQTKAGSCDGEDGSQSLWQKATRNIGRKAREDAERATMEKMCLGCGEEVLKKMGVSGLSVAENAKAQLCLLTTNVVITYLAMRAQGKSSGLQIQSFEENVKAPSINEILKTK